MAIRLSELVKEVRDTELIVTPVARQWLRQHGDDALTPEVARIIHEQLTTKPRNRSASFSASSATQCHRAQELQFLGMPGSDGIDWQLQNIFNDGKWRHLRWQAMGLQSGFLTRIEMPLFWRSMKSRGTIDGLGIVPDDHPRTAYRGKEYGFELKGVNPFLYQKAVKNDAGVKEEHMGQVARYFLMGGFDLFVTVYENKATQEWFEWVTFPDPEKIKEQKKELQALNDDIDSKRLSPMLPQCKIRTGQFNDCAYGGAHGSCVSSGRWPELVKKPTTTPKKSIKKRIKK